MKRLAAIVCTATLAVAALAGCGSDDSDASGGSGGSSDSGGGDYCDQVKSAKDDFGALGSGDVTVEKLRTAVDRIGDVAESAPSEVSSEWESVHSTLDQFVAKYEKSGIATDKPVDKAGPELAKKDPKAATELAKFAQQMQSDLSEMKSDQQAIADEVKDECGFEMGSGSSQ